MSTNVVIAVQALDGGAAVALAALVAAVLMRAVYDSHESEQKPAFVIAMAIAICAWFGVSSALAVAGEFSGATSGSYALAMLGASLVVPIAIGSAALSLVKPLRLLVSNFAVQPSLIALHSLRVIEGAVFLWMAALAILPAIFAVPAGAGDVIVGLLAIPASNWLRSGRRGRVVAWNLLGAYDLLEAIALGVLTTSGPLHLIQVNPSTAALLTDPLVVVPAFVVPFYLLIHWISLRYLAITRSQPVAKPTAQLEVSA